MMTTKNTQAVVAGASKPDEKGSPGTGLYAQRDIFIDGVAFAAGEEIPDTVDGDQVKICVRLGSVGGAPVQVIEPAAE